MQRYVNKGSTKGLLFVVGIAQAILRHHKMCKTETRPFFRCAMKENEKCAVVELRSSAVAQLLYRLYEELLNYKRAIVIT